jgi:hemoglobin
MTSLTIRGGLCRCGGVIALLAASLTFAEAPASASLYARLGGAPKLTLIVDELIDHAANAPQLKRSFSGVNLPRVKRLIVEQICQLAGGGCHYSGDSMKDVHAGLGLTEAEMNGLVEELRDAMRRHDVGLRERNELLVLLTPMKRDIVER